MAPKPSFVFGSSCEADDLEILKLERKYPAYKFRVGGEKDTPTMAREGELCVFLEHFKKGFELPIPESLLMVFKFFKIVPAQMVPNAIQIITGVHHFLDTWSVEWNAQNFLSLVSFGRKTEESLYVSPRHTSELGFDGLATSIHGWKSRFVFISCKGGWDFPTDIRPVDMDIFKRGKPTQEIQELYGNLQHPFLMINVKEGSYYTLDTPSKKKKAEGAGVRAKKILALKRPRHSKAPAEEEVGDDDGDDGEEEEAPLKKRKQPARAAKSSAMLHLAAPTTSTGSGEREGGSKASGDVREVEGEANVNPAEPSGPSGPWKGKEKIGESEAKESFAADFCRWDDEAETCSFNYNERVRIIPEQITSGVPLGLLDPLTSEEDTRYMCSLPISDLSRLQSQMAIGSSSVANHIVHRFRARLKMEKQGSAHMAKAVEASNEKLAASEEKLLATEEQLFLKEEELVKLKGDHLEEVKRLKKLLDDIQGKADAGKANEELLSEELQRVKEQLKAEKEASRKKIFDSDRLAESLKAAASKPACTFQEAEKIYKDSEAYRDAMSSFGDHGFGLLKKFLLKDGHVDQSTLDKYDYAECIVADAESDDE